MKKKSLQQIALTLLVINLAVRVHAQASVTASMFAEVISALSATENAQLSFGKFSPEAHGGEIYLSPEGVRSKSGSVVLTGEGHKVGSFIITGEDQATFSITLPSGHLLLTNSNGARSMIVKNWVSTPAQGVGAGILKGGTQEVKVGATLVVGSIIDNPAGIYKGTYIITFAYN